MKITKERLSLIDHISLILENCEVYDIKAEDILDIWFEEKQTDSSANKEIEVNDGRLLLSKNAFKLLSCFAYVEYENGTTALDHDNEEDYYLYNRIMECCDICHVEIYFKDGVKVEISAGYDPLECYMYDFIADNSNVPTAELNEDGNLLILFGKSSRAFKRTDNNYSELIKGIKEHLSKGVKGLLEVNLETFANSGNCCFCADDGLFVDFRIKNKEYKNKILTLVFDKVENLQFNFDLKNLGAEDFLASRISDGRIFVQIGILCNFYCSDIHVFEGF